MALLVYTWVVSRWTLQIPAPTVKQLVPKSFASNESYFAEVTFYTQVAIKYASWKKYVTQFNKLAKTNFRIGVKAPVK